MAATVLGVSGSPIPNSNTDRAMKAVLEAVGLEAEFVKLSDYQLEPCRGCLACVKTEGCVLDDDGPALAAKLADARAVVLGGYTPYSSLDARTKTFMERAYCRRHGTMGNAGKVGAAVITTACPPGVEGMPPAAETAHNQIAFWMMEEGMERVGGLTVLGNVPCIRCGKGDDCPGSGIKMLFGPEATVASVGVKSFEGDESLPASATQLGAKIRAALDA